MPQATDLVVKNGAATPVDKTFTLLTPAPGYGMPAEWALKEGDYANLFPSFTAAAQKTTNDSRTLKVKVKVPASYTDAKTGLKVKTVAFEFNGTASIPDALPESIKPDAVAYTVNLLGTALLKAMMKDGLPAT